ncbi:hypothetical protein [Actinokineospora globicatena]|uniref:hypothetical protein n=1 Tax=Actinokineospora globicatena TaxID=103729 RepID=UPI0020A2DB90|nr:hypothetical protein [Actinokineospora globicatena]MCP2302757.1 protein of unknown function (DUF4878) [Actinokineospora globicatena]GLW75553.1 hypothetical protein Aglo01_00350 [Actinokineospora globicatena]GLW82394.1 hypothetical protein Aglo02_00350 [Actinokineospora globicatena]
MTATATPDTRPPLTRRPGVLLGVGAAVAAVVGAQFWLFGTAEDTPAAAVSGYFRAAIDEDCPRAFDLLTDPVRGSYGTVERLCERAKADTMVSFQVGDTVTTPEGAKVTVTLVRPNLTLVDAVTMVQVDGKWKIASFEVLSSDRGHGQP